MSIQYPAQGFDDETSWLWVSSLNHHNRACLLISELFTYQGRHFVNYLMLQSLKWWIKLSTKFFRLIHIGFDAAACGRWLHWHREIEKFVSLCWHSLLWNPQTAAASVNEPLRLLRFYLPLLALLEIAHPAESLQAKRIRDLSNLQYFIHNLQNVYEMN